MAIKPPPKLAPNTCRATSRAKSNIAAERSDCRLSSPLAQHGGPANLEAAVFLCQASAQLAARVCAREKPHPQNRRVRHPNPNLEQNGSSAPCGLRREWLQT